MAAVTDLDEGNTEKVGICERSARKTKETGHSVCGKYYSISGRAGVGSVFAFELESAAKDHLDHEMVGIARHTDTDAKVKLPFG